ncbi:MAG TPA: CAP domain-containing protein [Candidatus Wunengus californicus]|uniref:CAP domain-containing protein n=1 Tax=Candidatus Wunengus californicus TaxID=3367619 RepID=UPI00402794FE
MKSKKTTLTCKVCKTSDVTEKCKYCGKRFCAYHITPIQAFKKFKNKKLIDYYNPYIGHTCLPYNESYGRGKEVLVKISDRAPYGHTIEYDITHGIPIPILCEKCRKPIKKGTKKHCVYCQNYFCLLHGQPQTKDSKGGHRCPFIHVTDKTQRRTTEEPLEIAKNCTKCNNPIDFEKENYCIYCHRNFCLKHYIPKRHDCPSLKDYPLPSATKEEYEPPDEELGQSEGINIPIKPLVVILLIGITGWYLYNNPEIVKNLIQKVSSFLNESFPSNIIETEETQQATTKEIPYILNYQQMKAYLPAEYQGKINDTLLGLLSKMNLSSTEGWQVEYKDYPQHATTTQKIIVELRFSSKISEKPSEPGQETKVVIQKPTSIDLNELEIKTHDLINAERQKYGLNPLKWNSQVASSARKYSAYLTNMNYLDHMDKNGKYHDDRLKVDGIYYFGASAENLAMTPKGDVIGCGYVYSMDELARCTVSGWMGSSGHRQNILTSEVDETGIGVATDDSREYYFTQVFIEHVYCGYETGPCCEETGYYPYCYVPLDCVSGVCK